jgi:creatinine amidohydrolase
MKKPWLDEMTYEEAAEAFRETDIAVICCGATHPHGVACPLGTDTFVAEGMGERIGRKSNVIVVPTIPFGYNEYHMDFPGCVNISRRTLFNLYMEICESLYKWGIRKLVFLTPHGGNVATIEEVAYHLRYDKGMLSAIVSYKLAAEVNPDLNGYGSEGMVDEASMMLYLRPDIVYPERSRFKEFKNPFGPKLKVVGFQTVKFGNAQIRVLTTSKEVSETCEWGEFPKGVDMSNTSRKLGEAIIETAVKCIVDFIEEFRKVKISPTTTK